MIRYVTNIEVSYVGHLAKHCLVLASKATVVMIFLALSGFVGCAL